MALSTQQAPAANLLAFCAEAQRRGFHVGEHPSYGGVHPVHTRGSWHYDGLAADINWRGAGSERDKLLSLIPLAESYGLGLIFARDGIVGAAANHQGHLHVDCGSWSNYGRGNVPAKAATRKPPTTAPTTPRPEKQEYELMRHLNLASAAKKAVTGRHVKTLQAQLLAHGFGPGGLVDRGGHPDGVAGAATRRELGEFQRRTKTGAKDGTPDYVVGDRTWAALLGLD